VNATVVLCCVAESSAKKTCGSILPQQRVDCGHPGITHDECTDRGCCWDTNVRDVPWCFDPTTQKPATTLDPHCDVGDPKTRVNCGPAGVDEVACLEKGCCYDASVDGVPWCFHPGQTIASERPSAPNCDVGEPGDRENCGPPTVDESACREKGCCWDSSVEGVPWCFHGASETMEDAVMFRSRGFSHFTDVYHDQTHSKCDVGERTDCGYPTIPEQTCRKRNCCWDDSIDNVPWCFYDKV